MVLAQATEVVHLIAFIAVFLTTLVAAFWVAAARDVIRAGVSLFICLAGVAGVYFLLNAQFLAVVQIMVYVGGTTVLILFGVMLTNRKPLLKPKKQVDRSLAGLIAFVMVAVPLLMVTVGRKVPGEMGYDQDAKLAYGWVTIVAENERKNAEAWKQLIPDAPEADTAAEQTGNVVALGDALLTSYILPFEIASVVLLIALVGASYLARRREDESGPEVAS